MGLRIIMRNADNKLVQVDWIVGHPSPFKGVHYNLIYAVGEVDADGPELSWIRTVFTGLPTTAGSRTRYFGDFARFIAGNLP